MPSFQAYELIYSRVEAPYSPRNRSGFQVAYHSPGLSDGIVREVENHLRCFEASAVSLRYQYFHLSSGQIGLALSQELSPVDTRVTDRAGRPGPFIAHCLILEHADFAEIENNPFVVFNAPDAFCLEIEEMLALQERKDSSRSLNVDLLDESPDYLSFNIEAWNKDAFTQLWYLAADAQNMLDKGQSVSLQAEDEESILALLELWMSHLPPNLRYACTFNSFVDSCDPMAGTYWLMAGFHRYKQARSRIRLDRQSVEAEALSSNGGIRDIAETVFAELRSNQGLDEEEED